MDFGFDGAHGDAIVREGDGGIGGVGAMIGGARNFGDGKRVDELRQMSGIERRTKFGRGLLAMMHALRQREARGKNSATLKKGSSG